MFNILVTCTRVAKTHPSPLLLVKGHRLETTANDLWHSMIKEQWQIQDFLGERSPPGSNIKFCQSPPPPPKKLHEFLKIGSTHEETLVWSIDLNYLLKCGYCGIVLLCCFL